MANINLQIGKQVDFTLYSGETWQVEMPITDSLGNPVPLSDAVITLVAALPGTSGSFALTLDDGLSVDDNKIVINALNTMPGGYWKYELTIIKFASPVAIIYGKLKVKNYL